LYDVRDPVADRLSFFGREALAAELEDLLVRGRPIALFGLRKMGKSSLLRYLRDKLPFPTALVDLQQGVGLADLCKRIIESWDRSLRVKVPGSSLSFVCPDRNLAVSSAFAETTRGLLASLEERNVTPRLILLVDEIDVMVPGGDDEGLDRYLAFARVLRGLVQEKPGQFSLVVVGVDPVFNRENRMSGEQNPFYQFFVERYVPALDPKDCEQMIRNIGQQMSLAYSDEALAFVTAASGGHPFLARQLCSVAFQRLSHVGNVSLPHLQDTAEYFVRTPDKAAFLDERGLWGEICNPSLWPQSQVIENQAVLRSLAQAEPRSETTLMRLARDCRAAEHSLIELEKRAIIERLERGRVRIRPHLFRDWIRRYKLTEE
jgi:hypothetical protein